MALVGSDPALAWLTLPILILYLGFVFLTWTAQPLFDLLLRLNRFGRLALSREQVFASNLVGGVLLVGLGGLGAAVLSGNKGFLFVGLGGLLLSLPVAGIFHCEKGWPRTAMAIYAGGLAVAGVLALLVAVTSGEEGASGVAVGLGVVFLLGTLYSGWVGNILASFRPKK